MLLALLVMVTVIMKVLALSCLIVLSLAGEICLPKGWKLEWSFPGDGNIEFVLDIDQHTWSSYGWVGIGMKYPDEIAGMEGADINNIILDTMPEDRYAEYNGMPTPDVEFDDGTGINGVNNILEPRLDGYVYTWKRPINSGDLFDKIYTEGEKMRLLWACGQVLGDVQMKHMVSDRDVADIELSEDFSIGCDESFVQLN